MAENMVFMMVTAMLKNFYLYLVRHCFDVIVTDNLFGDINDR